MAKLRSLTLISTPFIAIFKLLSLEDVKQVDCGLSNLIAEIAISEDDKHVIIADDKGKIIILNETLDYVKGI